MRPRSRADLAFERFRASGDPRALARCFDLTARELARVARHLARDPHRAEDLLQATYLTALERRAEFQPGEPVLPWLLGILANRARASRKSEARRPDPRRATEPSGEPDPADAAAWNETSDTLREVLRGFPSPYREVVTLHVLHGMSAREIGEALGVPAGTVRTQIVRGLERLRRRLPGGLALRGFLPMLGFPRLGFPRLGLVRRVVLARAGVELPTGIGAALLGGVLVMKSIVALLGLVFLVGAGWLLWPQASERVTAAPAQVLETAGLRAPTPVVPVAQSELRPPEVPGAGSAGRAALRSEREPMLVVRARRSDDGPAAGLHVRLVQESDDRFPELHERHLVTEPDGSARVDELPEGRWSVRADRGGEAHEVVLARGRCASVELALPVGIAVTGSVVDARARAVPGARLWLSSAPGDADRGLEVATADASGRFELYDVEPGRRIAARAEGYLDSFCATVEGAPGDALELELELAAGGGTLRGRVVDADGAPVAHAAVMSGYARGGMLRRTPQEPERPGERCWTDAEGSFELSGPLGATPLWVRAADFAPWSGTLEREASTDERTVVLARGAVLRGSIHEVDGVPVARQWVEVFHFALEPQAGNAFLGPEWARPQAFTDETGAFLVRALPAGRVRLTVEREGRIARREFELVEGGEEVWEAVLADPERIEGFVRDPSGAPLAGWSVWARTRTQGVREPRSGSTDVDGAFALGPCDDESYTLFLRGPGSLMSKGDQELAGVRPGGRPLEIVVPDERRANAGFTGLVRDAEGPVTEGLYVSLQCASAFDALGAASGRPRIEGERFVLESVLPGRYRVHVANGDAVGLEVGEFEVGPGETLELGTILLPESGTVALEVLDERGEPLAEARFVLRLGGSVHGDVIQVTGGKGRSRPLSAGTYDLQPFGGRTPLFRRPVEVRAGETTSVTLRLPHAVLRRVRYPPMERDTFVREVWTDGSGSVLRDALATYPSEHGNAREVFLEPDTYTVELSFDGTSPKHLTFVVEDHEDPDALLELPDPR